MTLDTLQLCSRDEVTYGRGLTKRAAASGRWRPAGLNLAAGVLGLDFAHDLLVLITSTPLHTFVLCASRIPGTAWSSRGTVMSQADECQQTQIAHTGRVEYDIFSPQEF